MALNVKDAAGATVQVSFTPFRDPAVGVTAVAVKASAGRLGSYTFYNPNTSDVYVNLYNVAFGSVTPGTTTPTWQQRVPAQNSKELTFGPGMDFSTAISINASTNSNGGSAPGTAVECSVAYV